MRNYGDKGWRHNRSHTVAKLYKPRCLVVRDAQASCSICADACTTRALTIQSCVKRGSKPYDSILPTNAAGPLINTELCLYCGACITSCPTNALLPQPPLDDEALLAEVSKMAQNIPKHFALTRKEATIQAPRKPCEKQRPATPGKPPLSLAHLPEDTGSEHRVSRLRNHGDVRGKSDQNIREATMGFLCERMAKEMDVAHPEMLCLPCLNWLDEVVLVLAAHRGVGEILLPLKACKTCELVGGITRVWAALTSAQAVCKAWRIPAVFKVVDIDGLKEGAAPKHEHTTEEIPRRQLLSEAGSSLIDIAKQQATSRAEAAVNLNALDNLRPDVRRWRLLDALHPLSDQPLVVPRVIAPRISIDVGHCTGCAQCALFCPTEALRRVGKVSRGRTLLEFDPSRCRDCGICEDICRYDALLRTESLSSAELFSLEPLQIVIPKRRVLPTRRS